MYTLLSFTGLCVFLICAITRAHASYNLVDAYDASNFFNAFTFFTSLDPTHGFVDFASKSVAQSADLATIKGNSIYLGVDYTTSFPLDPGRQSVRLSSNKAYTHGLFIADISHMPGSICGVWPAFWTFGPNWPDNGEIDIIEGVNQQNTNAIHLHTGPECWVNTAGSHDGTVLADSNCNTDNAYTGCGVTTSTPNAYGDSFNANGGGVYATQWESSGVYIWFFPRSNIPSDITAGAPVTANWGVPIVAFNGGSGCNVDSHFANHNIAFDTTFCGDWAGTTWATSGCAAYGATCASYVAANPGAFAQAYWLINSVKVYQQ